MFPYNGPGEVFRQIIRFGIVGVLLTGLVSGAYLALIRYASTDPALALTLATISATAIGYVVHGRFSFRDHGCRDRPSRRFVRFATTNGVGYMLNLGLVFLLLSVMRLPSWTPTLGFCFLTPAVTFLLNRHWVFA